MSNEQSRVAMAVIGRREREISMRAKARAAAAPTITTRKPTPISAAFHADAAKWLAARPGLAEFPTAAGGVGNLSMAAFNALPHWKEPAAPTAATPLGRALANYGARGMEAEFERAGLPLDVVHAMLTRVVGKASALNPVDAVSVTRWLADYAAWRAGNGGAG